MQTASGTSVFYSAFDSARIYPGRAKLFCMRETPIFSVLETMSARFFLDTFGYHQNGPKTATNTQALVSRQKRNLWETRPSRANAAREKELAERVKGRFITRTPYLRQSSALSFACEQFKRQSSITQGQGATARKGLEIKKFEGRKQDVGRVCTEPDR